MSGYINVNSDVNIENFLSLFRKLYDFIKNKFGNTESDNRMSFEELVEIYSNDNDFLNKLEYIKTSLYDIAVLMRHLTFCHGEYYNFMSIKNMIDYIVDDVGRYIKWSSFVVTLLTDFNNLIENQNASDYTIIYEKFDICLDEHEDYFYTEIFDETHEYDELVIKVTNILV